MLPSWRTMQLSSCCSFIRRTVSSSASPSPVDETARQRRIKELKEEMQRGYFADVAELSKNQGKKFIAASRLAPADAALEVPQVLGVTLCDKPVDVAQLVRSGPRASLLTFGFRQSARPMTDSFLQPFLDAFSNRGNVGVFEVEGVEGWLFGLFKGAIIRNLRKQIPSPRHASFVCRFEDSKAIRDTLLMHNPLIGHVFLVDGAGRVRWRAHSFAREDEIRSMIALTKEMTEST